MQQLIQNLKSGELTLESVPKPMVFDQFVLVKNYFSVISAGTEKSKMELAKKNLLQKALARPDLVKQVWKKLKTEGFAKTYQTVNAKLDAPSPLGYSSAGIVEEVGVLVEGILPGDRVACAGAGYANHADFVCVPKNLVVKIPDEVSLEEAAFTTIGTIAMQGVRLAKPELGECFLVLGLGFIGQITLQILMANGCQVIGFDPDPWKREIAKSFGCVVAENSEHIKSFSDTMTNKRGVDGTLICASAASNEPIETTGEVTRSKGRVVIVGVVGMNIPRDIYFKKEISLVVSRSYGPGRYDPHYEEGGADYPYDYVRFTEKRNMESFLSLVAQKKINLQALITHRFDFADAITAYGVLEHPTEKKFLGIVLKYAGEQLAKEIKSMPLALKKQEGKINISCLGCGNYATASILPILKNEPNVKLQAVMSATGRTAESVAKKFGFEKSVAFVEEAMTDATDLVMIMTRHNSHADLVSRALKAGKHVFVEKPLAISMTQFEEVKVALENNTHSHFLIGFNRRFSPLTIKLKEFFKEVHAPKMIIIRVNAGRIPLEHWIQDPEVGGGRIIGELCHFIDLANCIADSEISSVNAACISDKSRPLILQDNVQVSLKFKDGSLASIIYTNEGSSKMAKEYIEVFSGGRSAVIDDFKELHLFNQKKERVKLSRQDKGQEAMMVAFLNSLASDAALVSRENLLSTSYATLCAVETLSQKQGFNL